MSRSPATSAAPPAVMGVLILLVSFGSVSQNMYLPSMASLRADLSAEVWEAQLTLSVFLFGLACFQLVSGPLSDRFGRRPVLLGAIALFMAASAACALATSIEMLIAARLVQAAGASAGSVLSRAVVRDLFEPTEAARQLARIGTVVSLMPAAGPLLGGFFEVWFGWRSHFVFLGIFAAAMLYWIWAVLAESNRQRDPTALNVARMLRNYATLLANPVYLGNVLAIGFIYGALYGFMSGAPFVLIELFGTRPEIFGAYVFVLMMAFSGGAFGATRYIRRLGMATTALVGTALCMISTLALPVMALLQFDSSPAYVAAISLHMAGFGFAQSGALGGAFAPFPHMAGAASAFQGFSQIMGGAIAGFLVGGTYDGTPLPLTVIVGLSGTCAFLSIFLLVWPRRDAVASAG
jgi:DHA1 family bicyclomycin/chloramphenicol resistance-like MFS transporter